MFPLLCGLFEGRCGIRNTRRKTKEIENPERSSSSLDLEFFFQFTDIEIEAVRGLVTCPGLPSWYFLEIELNSDLDLLKKPP